jgi:phosphomannomutase
MPLMVSISGIRGVVGTTLVPETIVQYVSAYAEYCRCGKIIIGRDGRITGKNISNLISSVLLQAGCDVTDLGVCPTPSVALAVERQKASGGIAVTASHNPMQWNGLKFFAPTGLFLDAEENKIFWDMAKDPQRHYAPWDRQGSYLLTEDFIDEHVGAVLSLPFLSKDRIRKRKFRIVIDAVNAAGGIIVPRLLLELGCTCILQNCEVSGIFAHTPEPIPENLSSLCAAVKREHADLGIAVDPDVDRLVLIDEKGEPYGEEYTIATCADFILSKKADTASKPSVVVNLSTTRAIEDIAHKYHAAVIRTPVGEINVAKRMKAERSLIGGEGSGGVILPDVHYGRDAVVGIGIILQYLAEFNGPLSALKAGLPQYFIVKGRVDLGTLDPDAALERIEQAHAHSGKVTKDDGLKIDFAHSWVHLRKSNTEPIIRIIAEAPARTEAEELVRLFTEEIIGS